MLVLPLFDCATPFKQQNKLLKAWNIHWKLRFWYIFLGFLYHFKLSNLVKKKLCKILCKTVCQCNSIWTSEFHKLFVVMKDILIWFAYIYIMLNINFIFFYWKYWPIFSLWSKKMKELHGLFQTSSFMKLDNNSAPWESVSLSLSLSVFM